MQISSSEKESWGGVAYCQHLNRSRSQQALSTRMSKHTFP